MQRVANTTKLIALLQLTKTEIDDIKILNEISDDLSDILQLGDDYISLMIDLLQRLEAVCVLEVVSQKAP